LGGKFLKRWPAPPDRMWFSFFFFPRPLVNQRPMRQNRKSQKKRAPPAAKMGGKKLSGKNTVLIKPPSRPQRPVAGAGRARPRIAVSPSTAGGLKRV